MTLKQLFAICLIAFIAFLPLLTFSPLASAQSGTSVGGLIGSDTVWTKNGSPYNLTGPLGVKEGVTLTIEAGTVVNLGYYYMQINGTLIAKGTSTDQIQISGGETRGLTVNSPSSQSTIQYAAISSALTVASTTVDHCTIKGLSASASTVSNNIITGGVSIGDSTLLSGNDISGAMSMPPSSIMPIVLVHTSEVNPKLATIQNNFIHGGNPTFGNRQDTGIMCSGDVTVDNNTITYCEEGIRVISYLQNEAILIQKNTIYNNMFGIVVEAANSESAPSDHLRIEQNLITGNTAVGISIQKDEGSANPSIKNNSIYDNQGNFEWILPTNFDVSGNWWGTTNETAISQSIYDSKYDFNLGTVTYQPILTAPNPETPTAPTTNPTTTETPAPSPSPAIPEFTTTVTITILIVAALIAVIVKKSNRKW